MNITFVGTSTCTPDVGSEVASFVIDRKHLVDAGWCAALAMRRYALDPLEIESVILTHLHQDHYLGLPALLFFTGLRGRGRPDRKPVRIIGPGEHLQEVVDAAVRFLQIPRFPEIAPDYTLLPLRPGDEFELGQLRVATCAAKHVSGAGRPEPALAYRVTDPASGASFAFSGDTSFHPPIADLAKGLPLLIHDGAHTRPGQAAEVAKMAGVHRLLLIHYSKTRADEILTEAQQVFPNSDLAREGESLDL